MLDNVMDLSSSLAPKIPSKVGVFFSGGPAPGGHDVVCSLYDALPKGSKLFGFLGGPGGLIQGKAVELEAEMLERYRGQGGFDLLGSGRDKFETQEQFEQIVEVIQRFHLDGIVVIGGDDSNSNAAHLANHLKGIGSPCTVVGIPKTIDGDLQTEEVKISFGFDTATKVYSELIGNLARDTLSSLKYYHVVRLMGRSASHVALECAMRTHPNLALIGEEIAANKTSLKQIGSMLADLVIDRERQSKSYGVILVPEGLIEFIPEMQRLIQEVNALIAAGQNVAEHLSPEALETFQTLPKAFREQILLDRDPHGNVQVSKIETEKLLIAITQEELDQRGFKAKFETIAHFYGYEGRCAHPSAFDRAYCSLLGKTAAILIHEKLSGYMAGVKNLELEQEHWTPIAINLNSLFVEEMRKGEVKQVIQKTLVDINSNVFRRFQEERKTWRLEDRWEMRREDEIDTLAPTIISAS